MARTIDTIYKDLVTQADRVVPELTKARSRTSICGLLLYICAVLANTVEKLFDTHKTEVETMIGNLIPHTCAWYAMKALAYQRGDELPDGEDEYAVTDTSKQIVKRAVAVEDETSALHIKIATLNGSTPAPMAEEDVALVKAYMEKIKDAGVMLNVTSEVPEDFSCTVKVYYDGSIPATQVESECRTAVKNYVTDLPFNGLMTRTALVDAVQTVSGVTAVAVESCSVHSETHTPTAGYFKVREEDITIQLQTI